MTDVNVITILGRLTKDLDANNAMEFAYSSNGTARANVSIAVNRSVKKGDQWQDEASFFNVTIWGKTAENLKQYLTKGQQICVSGYLKQDRWQDKQTGQNRSTVSIVADTVQLCGGNRQQNNNSGYQNQQNNPAYVQSAPATMSWQQPQQQFNQPVQNGFQTQPGFNAGGFPEDIPF